jgi:hypothetical protein
MATKPFTTNYREYYTKLTEMIASYSQDASTQEHKVMKYIILYDVLENQLQISMD